MRKAHGFKLEVRPAPGFGLGVFVLKTDRSLNFLVGWVVFRVEIYRSWA